MQSTTNRKLQPISHDAAIAGGRMGESLGLSSLAANDNNPPDLPLAIVDTVNTTPTLLMVHTDHLGRPTRLTDSTKATVWQAAYKPWGEVQSISGTRSNNLRFPGQYFQIETNLAYNHHRHYDPTTGRYTQPDPLRFVDGPSIYAYAGNSPFMYTDRQGLYDDGLDGLRGINDVLRSLGFPVDDIPPPQQCTATNMHFPPVMTARPPGDAHDPDGAKAPGKPGPNEGFHDPAGGESWVPNPNGRGNGWLDADGNVWVPTGQGGSAHGGPHWDVQGPRNRSLGNVYPGGHAR